MRRSIGRTVKQGRSPTSIGKGRHGAFVAAISSTGGPHLITISSSPAGHRKREREFGLLMPFDLQPILKGELLELRPLRTEDYDPLFAVAGDPRIWEQHPNKDRYQEEVFRVFFQEAMQSGGALVAIDSGTGEVIGSSRFYGYDPERSEVEIGWTFLARSHWGGVYNGEMKRLMVEHAFKFVTRIVFLIGEQNFRSRKAVEKIGAVHVGFRSRNGQDFVVYQITRSA